jgi:hypothetical protein
MRVYWILFSLHMDMRNKYVWIDQNELYLVLRVLCLKLTT